MAFRAGARVSSSLLCRVVPCASESALAAASSFFRPIREYARPLAPRVAYQFWSREYDCSGKLLGIAFCVRPDAVSSGNKHKEARVELTEGGLGLVFDR
jgi:hypothetical protein